MQRPPLSQRGTLVDHGLRIVLTWEKSKRPTMIISPKAGRWAARCRALSSLGRRTSPRQGPPLPRRDDGTRQARNVPAWEGLQPFSQKNGRFRRNVPARERSGRARSRLGRAGEKGHRVYLRERRGPPLPEAASFSQAGTLRREAAYSPLRQQSFSRAGTLIQHTRASPCSGEAPAPVRGRLSQARTMVSHGPHIVSGWERNQRLERASLPRRADGRLQAAQRLCLGEIGVCKIPALKCGRPFRALRVFVAQRPCLKERCAYTRKTAAWD